MDLPLSVLSQVAAILEQHGIRYVLVGSFASSIHGMYRATADIDIVADIKEQQVHTLCEALQNDFYVDEQAMRDAVIQRRSFDAIHFDSVFKVDFFIPKSDEFGMSELDRRQLIKISPERDEAVYVATAEDTILAKLRWFRAGNETSINQWNDVVGILGISHPNLDFNYLRTWANELGLISLLQKALEDAQDDSTI